MNSKINYLKVCARNKDNYLYHFSSNLTRDISHLSTNSNGNHNKDNEIDIKSSKKIDNLSLKFIKNQSEDFYTNEYFENPNNPDLIEKKILETIIIEENTSFSADDFNSEVNDERLTIEPTINHNFGNSEIDNKNESNNQNNFKDRINIFLSNENSLNASFFTNKNKDV